MTVGDRVRVTRVCRLRSVFIPLALLAACGGGGDSGGTSPTATDPAPPPSPPQAVQPTWTPGVYPPSATFAQMCRSPRSGVDAHTGRAWQDRPGTALHEKHWLRSWTHELYLWYSEVPDRDPASVAGVLEYFDIQKTVALTATGKPKDAFHFAYDTEEWHELSLGGTELGYGVRWVMLHSAPPRRLVVAYVEPGSPAAAAGIARGMEVTHIDGVDFVGDNTPAGVDALNRALLPDGETHQFVFRDRDGAVHAASLAARAVTTEPVPLASVLPGKVGYLLFNDHIATSESRLVSAIQFLAGQTVTDLVLDLRYNGGGYLDIASELAYMIGGAHVYGRTFEQQQFNARYPTTNPVTGEPLRPVPFHDRAQGFSVPAGTPLPTLNLSRVVVLTTQATCSASEAIINGLRGANVEVIQVGGTTCGKPYGFYPTDNCGTTYFTIQFRSVNGAGFGDYAAGFSASRTVGDARANLPGCDVPDDFAHDLGDPAEGQLAAALTWLAGGQCAERRGARAAAATSGGEGLPVRLPARPWRENRFLVPPDR